MATSPAPRSMLLVWVASLGLLLVTLAALSTIPFGSCPDCEGEGREFVLEPRQETRGPCGRCGGKGRISPYKKWTTMSAPTYVGAADMNAFVYITPLLAREGIPVLGRSASLGIMEFDTDSPPHARRALALIEQDAKKNNYRFWHPGAPNPWSGK